MRYFIYYPPTKSLKRVDVVDNTCVQDIIGMVKYKFGLKVDTDHQDKTSIVLNYNGSDLKPTWSLTDLGVPTGAIIRCLYRAKKNADLYVHCEFNNQLLELFDDTITIETTIGEIRKKISDRIGIPLSTFCIEMHDIERRRLHDRMKLFQCDLKVQDHVYLKVWPGYEDFLNSCMKGFPKKYSHDDLIRHYQLQIALHFAAFYGFMELGHIVLQLGARSDCPVGEHPSRQWSSEITTQDMPEMLKCPIHIAIERGQMKMVDLFFRQSLLCTQVIHPVSQFLPYRLALSMSMLSKTKVEKQRYKQIYLYLYDKQFNLKIPLNTNTGSDPRNSIITANTNANSLHRSTARQVFFSLPRYCKIIRWYERAQARVWKKYGVHIENSTEIKRASQSKGLLGYKIWIDGFNNTFDSSNESICSMISGNNKSQADQTDYYSGYTEEELQKIRKMKVYMKQFGADEQQRRKSTVAITPRKIRHPPLLAQHGLFGAKMQHINFTPTNSEDMVSKSSFIGLEYQSLESVADSGPSSNKSKPISKKTSKSVVSTQQSPTIPVVHQKKEQKSVLECDLLTQSELSFKSSSEKSRAKTRSTSIQASRSMVLDVDSYTPHSDHRKKRNLGPLQFQPDLKILQTTMKCYERHASTLIHETAVHCLEEASFFKRKSWLKQVEISKEMVKQRTKRFIQRTDDRKNNSAIAPMRVVSSALFSNTTKC